MKKLIAVFIMFFGLTMVVCAGCTSVNSGTVGVYSSWGKIDPVPMEPGVHLVNPFIGHTTHMDVKLTSFEVQTDASSKDLQVVKTRISVQHSLDAKQAPAVLAAIGNVEAIDNNVISPAVSESLKAVTAKYTAEELISKREAVKKETERDIQVFLDQTLEDKGVPKAVRIVNLSIKDFDFSTDFNVSIEAKVKAQQEALRAESEATKTLTAAKAKAGALELEAKAKASALELEGKALKENRELALLRAIERWDGKAPNVLVNMSGLEQILHAIPDPPVLQINPPQAAEVAEKVTGIQ